jgi:hypothetical protein
MPPKPTVPKKKVVIKKKPITKPAAKKPTAAKPATQSQHQNVTVNIHEAKARPRARAKPGVKAPVRVGNTVINNQAPGPVYQNGLGTLYRDDNPSILDKIFTYWDKRAGTVAATSEALRARADTGRPSNYVAAPPDPVVAPDPVDPDLVDPYASPTPAPYPSAYVDTTEADNQAYLDSVDPPTPFTSSRGNYYRSRYDMGVPSSYPGYDSNPFDAGIGMGIPTDTRGFDMGYTSPIPRPVPPPSVDPSTFDLALSDPSPSPQQTQTQTDPFANVYSSGLGSTRYRVFDYTTPPSNASGLGYSSGYTSTPPTLKSSSLTPYAMTPELTDTSLAPPFRTPPVTAPVTTPEPAPVTTPEPAPEPAPVTTPEPAPDPVAKSTGNVKSKADVIETQIRINTPVKKAEAQAQADPTALNESNPKVSYRVSEKRTWGYNSKENYAKDPVTGEIVDVSEFTVHPDNHNVRIDNKNPKSSFNLRTGRWTYTTQVRPLMKKQTTGTTAVV